MDKKELRKEIRQQIAAMSDAEKQSASLAACQRIMRTPEWDKARTILLYAAMSDEIDTRPLIDQAHSAGKRVILPVVDGDDLRLFLYSPDKVQHQGIYSILEPTPDCEELRSPAVIDLAIIPGRAFTPDGCRMGRGRGYYDRLLPQLRCPLWGIGFACQMRQKIPTEQWDVTLNAVFC